MQRTLKALEEHWVIIPAGKQPAVTAIMVVSSMKLAHQFFLHRGIQPRPLN